MEFGIMQLRNKGDSANAEFFEKKIQEKKEEGTLKGFGKKLGIGGLFGKKK
jgi:hypothetical protein